MSSDHPATARWRPLERRSWVVLGLLTLFGAFLRAYQLDRQFFVGDEWHSVFHTLQIGYWSTSVVYWLLEHTIGLWEWMIRGAYLALGVAIVFLVPAAVTGRFGLRIGATYAGFLAMAPFLVYYSRFARPYALVAVLCLASVWLFHRWWARPSPKILGAYLTATALALALNVLHVPFVASPFLQTLASLRSHRSPEFRRLLTLGATVIFSCGVVLALPILYSLSFMVQTADLGSRKAANLPRVLQLFFGTNDSWTTLAIAALVVWGLAQKALWRSAVVRGLLLASAIQVAVVFLVAPAGSGAPHIFGRYATPVLFVLLFLASVGLADLTRRLGGCLHAAIPPALTVAVLMFLYLSGPVHKTLRWPNSWIPDELLWRMAGEENFYRQAVHATSAFYRDLARESPASFTLIEAPWDGNTNRNPFPLYQWVHRQQILMGYPGDGWNVLWRPGPPFGLRSSRFVPLDQPEEVRRRGDFLVFHKALHEEMRILTVPLDEEEIQARQMGLEVLMQHAPEHYGPAVFEDAQIVVYRLDQEP